MIETRQGFFDRVTRFLNDKLFTVSREYTTKEVPFDQGRLEYEREKFFYENMRVFIEKEANIKGILMNDGKKMIVSGELLMMKRKEFIDFMQDIYENLELKRRRDLVKLQGEIANIDFWEKLHEIYGSKNETVNIEKSMGRVTMTKEFMEKAFNKIISSYAKM